jgi:predicted amidohydrolase YtcJ
VTHEYTLLVGGTVIRGGTAADAQAIAWAHGVILAIGSNAEVRAISRGDSTVIDLGGACVVPLARDATLDVGGSADLAILATDPRLSPESGPWPPSSATAVVRGGRVVSGALPG